MNLGGHHGEVPGDPLVAGQLLAGGELVLLTSSERVHKWRLCDGLWGEHLLGFANLSVRLSKL